MKHAKDRVVAIDYFRGLCILLVVINHAVAFSMPFALFAGAGGLYTSAAEMFLLLSGVTFAIVRGHQIGPHFSQVVKKTWRRAGILYLINLVLVVCSLAMAVFAVSHNLTNNVAGSLPANNSWGLLADILTFKYTIGWADFLMYYSVFLLFAPFIYYLIKTRAWVVVLAVSMGLYAANFLHALPFGVYNNFFMWQIYFVLGLILGRFRLEAIGWFYNLPRRSFRWLTWGVLSGAAVMTAVSFLEEHSIYNTVSRLAGSGWLPVKLQAAYIHLLNIRPSLHYLFVDGRAGLLRPLATILTLLAAYLLYQKFKSGLLNRTEKLITVMGRDSLWIFIAQAVAIPIFATLPVKHGPFVNNFILTANLLILMWLITERATIAGLLNRSYEAVTYSLIRLKLNLTYQLEETN